MPWSDSAENFTATLEKLVKSFSKNLAFHKSSGYDEASVRVDFLNPFFRALGWDVENLASAPQSLREVQIETRVSIGGTKKRADYMFRTNGIDRLVFEAKAPHVTLAKKEAYQAQRYAFNLKLLPTTLGNFDTLQFFVVGGKPEQTAPWDICIQWHYTEYVAKARQIWELFSREAVGQGSLDRYIDALPKRSLTGAGRQGWLIKRDRIKTVDKDFLAYIEELRSPRSGFVPLKSWLWVDGCQPERERSALYRSSPIRAHLRRSRHRHWTHSRSAASRLGNVLSVESSFTLFTGRIPFQQPG
jgi:hypothetical protein